MITLVTITGTFLRANDEPAFGAIIATLSAPIVNGTTNIEPSPILGALNKEGKLKTPAGEPFLLAANDDTGTLPAGTHYEFVLKIDNAPIRAFFATVSHTVTPVDLSTLQP